ncbi:hypothetical protein B4U80_14408, partial [Leptotrombidium deliense]
STKCSQHEYERKAYFRVIAGVDENVVLLLLTISPVYPQENWTTFKGEAKIKVLLRIGVREVNFAKYSKNYSVAGESIFAARQLDNFGIHYKLEFKALETDCDKRVHSYDYCKASANGTILRCTATYFEMDNSRTITPKSLVCVEQIENNKY